MKEGGGWGRRILIRCNRDSHQHPAHLLYNNYGNINVAPADDTTERDAIGISPPFLSFLFFFFFFFFCLFFFIFVIFINLFSFFLHKLGAYLFVFHLQETLHAPQFS